MRAKVWVRRRHLTLPHSPLAPTWASPKSLGVPSLTPLQEHQPYLELLRIKQGDLDQLKVIHVTGTKGKGSTCTFAESILRGCGLRTGLFTSPHFVKNQERIRINNVPLSDVSLAACMTTP